MLLVFIYFVLIQINAKMLTLEYYRVSHKQISHHLKFSLLQNQMSATTTIVEVNGQSIDLPALQDKIKRQPELYRNEFNEYYDLFKKLLPDLRDNPGKDQPTICSFLLFFTHLFDRFPKELQFLSTELVNIVEQYYGILHVTTRAICVQCLTILRSKNLISPTLVIPLFVKLFKSEDKKLRESLFNIIVNDIKRINKQKKNVVWLIFLPQQHINTQLQNCLYNLIEHHTDKTAKAALLIMLELYRRRVWTDTKTVNAISSGCLSKNSKMVMAACKFMLDINLDGEDLEEDESDQEDKKIEIRRQLGSKLPKKKKDELRKMLKMLERKQRRKHRATFQTNFLPIDLVYNPQGFTEKLFSKLTKGKGKKKELKGEAAILALSLVAKMIGRHKLIIPEFFTYANHAIKTKNKNIARLLACVAEACHENLQREDVKDMVGTIIDNLISEHNPPESITMGLNAIREISLRISHVLEKDQLAYLVQFKDFKNKYVGSAAKSVINAYRDINPMLLPPKLRGMGKEEEEGVTDKLGKAAGLELLQNEEGKNILTEKILDDADFKKIKLLRLKESAKAMGAVKERKDVLDMVREKIEELREQYLTKDEENEEDLKLAGKRKAGELEEEASDLEQSEDEGSVDDEELEKELLGEGEDEEEGSEEEEGDEDVQEEEDDQEEEENNSDAEEANIEAKKDNEEPMEELLSESDSEVDVYANQGFVSVEDINTYKKPKRERIKEALAQQVKEKHKRHIKKKTGSSTNAEKVKNKPYMMVLPKKRHDVLRAKYKSVKERIKDLEKKSRKIRQGKIKVRRKIYVKSQYTFYASCIK
eukprot:TRINITY_DN139_c0_g1_i10.p6 TRINITY_DN139_c0_g1~~TRINITY_DN139_c0_g1_i10.p6  ORF type:complete len:820 (-),score=155.54 TRINITY_DN139_c0_g1_i10:3345-5804(-)